MKLISFVLFLATFSSCSFMNNILYPGGEDNAKVSAGKSQTKTCDSAEEREQIVKLLYAGSFIPLQEIMKDCNLKGQSDLHNYISLAPGRDQYLENMARFFISKGALPVEKDLESLPQTVEKHEIDTAIVSHDGPLQTILSEGRTGLVSFYLEKLSPEDVMKGSFGFKGTRPETIGMFSSERKPELQRQLELNYILKSPNIYATVKQAIRKNSELCQTGHEGNCKARDHLNMELDLMHSGVQDIATQRGCQAQMELTDANELMEKQMELGTKTSAASPKTYDFYAKEAQANRRALKVYKQIYRNETGVEMNLSHCS